jgi:hypothetical protein
LAKALIDLGIRLFVVVGDRRIRSLRVASRRRGG